MLANTLGFCDSLLTLEGLLRVRILVFVLFTAIGSSFSAFGQSVVLGALEEFPGDYAGDHYFYGLRVLFKKSGSEWVAFPTCMDQGQGQECLKEAPLRYPRESRWTISFDGRKVGQLTGRRPERFPWYSHIGLESLPDNQKIPAVGNRSEEFGGFIAARVHRPLVANSHPYYLDPDAWHVIQASPTLAGLLRKQFRKKFPELCTDHNDENAKLEPFPYRDADVRVVKAYVSKGGWRVARLELSGAIECDDTEAGFGLSEQWFVVDPQKEVRYLGTDMWLVDAGDYDNDGKSEILFAIDGDNRGGYRLFYDDFKKQAVFEYSYH